jgi:PAT family beta-lactamase induction signal transducer AmpG
VIGVGLVIAIASATQDITIDALRIEQIEQHETLSMAAGAAIAVVGWWTGYKVGGIVALFTAEFFQKSGFQNYWQISFVLLCLVVVLCSIGLLFVKEKTPDERIKSQLENEEDVKERLSSFGDLAAIIAWVYGIVLEPLLSFFKKNGVTIGIYIISFIFLFKVGEAFLGRMSIIFYKEIGFSKSDIALYSKGIGWITTVCFTLIGGVFAIRAGIVKALFISGIAMASTNLFFSLLAWVGKSELLFAMAVLLDDLAAAFATVAFVAFISLLVDRTYTATQYALLASIGTAGRTLLASSSGAMVDWLEGDWGTFFVITAIMVIPSLAILWMIKNKLKLG